MSTTEPNQPKRALSLGVIFLTLYIDLVGFSIIFPLGPDLLKHYLAVDGQAGLLGWFLGHINAVASHLGNETHLPEVLFGGVISSLFSILQFIFAPFWGTLSDKRGRRPILLLTVAGTALSYLLWVVSGSFWLFLVARLVAGAFGGNLSVATAAVADVTTRAERSKAMGIVGAAFGLGLVTGPMIGAFTAHINLLEIFPRAGLAAWGINPFSVPALLSLAMSVVNLVWIYRRFNETRPPEMRIVPVETRLRNPLRAILNLSDARIRGVNLVAFVYSIAFVAMEASLVFLSAERFGYTAKQNGLLMGFLGVCSIITQGYIVRKMLVSTPETRVLGMGLVASCIGLLLIGFAPAPAWLYAGVGLLALGSGLVNPSTSGLISLYAGANEQGRVLGIFRSLGSLSRAITPITAGIVFWTLGAKAVFIGAAVLAAGAWIAGTRLPQPEK
ncbi:MFS transporter [Rariglobus hedericola]|uniref:MFS transporter n=1 Tax=Rariglobus hedericola TaxID=2597822 RepID=A0A556QES1_9BACT|nr:MFS transporter [Rariglobus hedericola]TSJ75111.1 MFS transporter [Rariglobus hedericola]